jgi:NAD(P)-dependent dehydrogenase (short-subunit alcohol dehydrogenase family)
MSANILVTGAAGYIGGLTVAALAADERVNRLVAYDLRPARAAGKATVVTGDITTDDLGALLRAHDIDTVVHLASILKPPVDAPPDLAWRVDVEGTRRLLEACTATGVGHLVVTTSGAAYGYHPDNPMWLGEDAPIRGHDAFEYSRNKRQVEELLAGYRASHPELTQLLLRPGTVIGRGTHSPVTEIFEGPVIVGVRGSAAPFVFIWDRDLVSIIVTGALERRSGIFNVAGDGALTAREIARRLHKRYLPLPAGLLATALGLLKRWGKSAHGAETVDFLRYRPVLDNRRLKGEFGYIPVSSAAAFSTWLDNRDAPADPAAPGDADDRPVVLITGAAGGIGRALALRWACEGARIAMLDFEADHLAEAATVLGDAGAEVFPVEADVTDYASCNRAVEAVVGHFGRIDVLVNNAGTVHRSAFADTDIEVYRKVMEVNFFGSLNCSKAALPHLLERKGLIVVISSIAGIAPLYGRTGYAASKHALHGLFESARTELRERGVRVMLVCPNFTRSPFEQRAMGADGRPAGTERSMTGRLAEPGEVAAAVVAGARQGKNLLVLTGLGKLSYYLSRLAPGLYARGMVRRLKTGREVR